MYNSNIKYIGDHMSTLPLNTPYYGGKQTPNPVTALKGAGTPPTNVKGPQWIVGQTLYLDEATGGYYVLTAIAAGGAATWAILANATGPLDTLTGDAGGAISPSGGDIILAGTANEIHTAGAGHTITFTLPAAVIAPGSLASTTTITAGTGITATTGNIVATAGNITTTAGSISAHTTVTAGTSITATLGDITATNGNLVLNHTGNKLVIHASTAASDSIGTSAALTNGVVVVNTTAVTASSLIFLSYNTCASTLSCSLSYGTIVPTTSFTITSQDLTDSTSTVNYWIIN